MKLDAIRFSLPLLVISVLLIEAADYHVLAQRRQAQPDCPTVTVSCPDLINAGEPMAFTADLRGGDRNVTPTFNWTVSAGTISSGQGTSSITVDTTGLPGNSSVTATVDVGGFSRSCSTSASCTASVMKKVEARKVDEYAALAMKDEQARLDNFTIELNQDPTAAAYVIAYGGRAGRAGDAQKAADRAKDYLVSKRGIDSSRVITLDGGYREKPAVELWLVPSGAQPPIATPTVDPSELKPKAPAKKPAAKKPAQKPRAGRKS